MSLAATTLLAPHFTAAELGADDPDIPGWAQSNLYQTAAWLEAARGVLGVPIDVKSGWRSPTHNLEVGGSATSDHPTGLAGDWKARGLPIWTVYRALKDNPLPPFDQLIFYPIDGHIHVGLGSRKRGEYRLALAEGGYPLITPELEAKLRGAAPILLLLVVLGIVLYAFSRKGA